MSSFEANSFPSVVLISIEFVSLSCVHQYLLSGAKTKSVTLQVQILTKLLSNWRLFDNLWKLNLPARNMKAGISLLNCVFKCRR